MRRAAMHLAAMLVVTLGGCAIEWKVPEQSHGDGAAGPGGGGGSGGGGGAGASASSSSSSSAGGAEDCDQGTGCTGCLSCAWNGECAGLYGACMSDPDCQAIAQCAITTCSDSRPTSTCTDDCVALNLPGEAQFRQMLACLVCDVCPMTCDEIGAWACP